MHRQEGQGCKTRRGRSKDKKKWGVVEPKAPPPVQAISSFDQPPIQAQSTLSAHTQIQGDPSSKSVPAVIEQKSKLGTVKDHFRGETSGSAPRCHSALPRSASGTSRSVHSDVQPDSSDVESSNSEEGEFGKLELDFEVVRNRKRFSGQKGKRRRGPKIN